METDEVPVQSVTHILDHLSSPPPSVVTYFYDMPEVCTCSFCGQLVTLPTNPPTPCVPLSDGLCLLPDPRRVQSWQPCIECMALMACLYYYAGAGVTTAAVECELTPAELDVYVAIERGGFPQRFTPVSVPRMAQEIGRTAGAIRGALYRLQRRGLVQKMRQGRVCWYRPLVWMLPKGE